MANTLKQKDIFGQVSSTFGGSFSADDALMTFPSILDKDGNRLPAETPLLLQNAAFSYQQQVTRLYDLTSSNVYYVRGRAQGDGRLGQVLGPAKLSQSFISTYGSVCNAGKQDLNFTMLASCSDLNQTETGAFGTDGGWAGSHGFTCKFVVLTSLGLQMAAQSMVIQQDMAMTYASFEYLDNATAGVSPSTP